MKVIGEIYEESDYSKFKKLHDNRDVLADRLSKLIASISERYVLNPIVVNEKMEIIDGQGRYEAMKSLRRPIHYIVSRGATSSDCRRMNKYNKSWSKLDFAKSYAKSGNQNYVWVLKAVKDSKFTITAMLTFICKGQQSVLSKKFDAGELIFGEEDYRRALFIREKADEIKEALQYPGRLNSAFYLALSVMLDNPKYNHERMILSAKNNRSTYSQMSRMSDQLVEFERIYNYKIALARRVYFSDYLRNRGYNVRDYSKANIEKCYSEYTDRDIRTLREA